MEFLENVIKETWTPRLLGFEHLDFDFWLQTLFAIRLVFMDFMFEKCEDIELVNNKNHWALIVVTLETEILNEFMAKPEGVWCQDFMEQVSPIQKTCSKKETSNSDLFWAKTFRFIVWIWIIKYLNISNTLQLLSL